MLVLGHSAYQLILMFLGPLVSFLVIRQAGLAQWGAFVPLLISLQLAGQLLSWGNKEYLLRAFARDPANKGAVWRESFLTRALLFLPLGLLLAFLFPAVWSGWLLLWLLGLLLVQSHEVLVVYRRAFRQAAVVELAGAAVLAAGILGWGERLAPGHLASLFALAFLLKGLLLSARFIRDTDLLAGSGGAARRKWRIDPAYFRLAMPFFLLGFSGLLQSRIDLYVVAYFLPGDDVARYQVFMNLLIYLQAAANIILLPFVPTIYRLAYPVIARLSRRLFVVGAVVLPPALALVSLLLRYLYEIELDLRFYLWGGLFVWPLYFFLPIIYALYQANRQNTVIAVNLAGIALNVALDILLLPAYGLVGVVASAALVKWLVLVVYWLCGRQIGRAEKT
jgi:O-antigen/teichoic acid export membrane protein